jgi:hypothetical protein
LECDNSATFGSNPKRRTTSAACSVISASCAAVGLRLMCVSTMNTWRVGRISAFIAA